MTNPTPSNVLRELQQLLNTSELADLGPRRRSGAIPLKQLNQQIDWLLAQTAFPQRAQDLIRGTLLLWHDHLDEAHSIAQEIENADGSLLHAIMHRREPVFGNSKYWFRRVGKHPCYPNIAGPVTALFGREEEELASGITPGGKWEPFAFVDVCEEATQSKSQESPSALLQQVQKMEFEALLDYLLRLPR